ncbi:hypothetical protein [Streptomyces sp. NPDC003077]|uniref:hypothetical protein n=1 Tax=Streptomyces sp. NPDC003077 TaxID=3154443 RepID=UPI0033BB5FF3
MALTDDFRKTLTDPTPLYFLAGTADLAAEKLGEVPALVGKIREEAPKRFETVRNTDPKDVQELVTKQAKQAQDKLAELLGSLDADLKSISRQAQDLALQGVGRVAEYAVKAQETYGELAERGKGAVRNWRGEVAEEVEELAVAIEPEPETDKTAGTTGTGTGTESEEKNGSKPATAKKSSGSTARKSPAKKAASAEDKAATPAEGSAEEKPEGK